VKFREALALYRRSEDLIQLGAHVQGANARLDASIRAQDRMRQFLKQDAAECADSRQALTELKAIAGSL
jgi:flagellum-specific ATP synthase